VTLISGDDPDLNTTEFLWEVHRYVNEYIRFADTKAAFIAGATTPAVVTIRHRPN
jgi:hypothetical protein